MSILSILAPAVPFADTPEIVGAQLPITLADGRSVEHANFDYAATAPSLVAAADAVTELLPWYGSVHRGAGFASRKCTLAYERARETITDFIGARDDDHVIFTRNTTDALNLLARALPPNTTVVGWAGEHHANLLPWTDVVRLPVPESPTAATRALTTALAQLRGPILVAVTGASNVTGEVWPIGELTEIAHRAGARIVVDAAQLAPHRPISLTELDIDYIAFSGHKLYAPFGIGVLAGRSDWLDAADPYLAGGGATAYVGDTPDDVCWQIGPARHEAGTPNLLGAVALAAACTAIAGADRVALEAREQALLRRLRSGLADIGGIVELRTFGGDQDRVGIVSFVVDGVASDEVSAYLANQYGISVRDGLFCAHPLSRHLVEGASKRAGTWFSGTAVRASIGLGTTVEHVDRLITALKSLAHR